MVVLAPISTSSWITTRPICGTLRCPPAPMAKPKPSCPMRAPAWIVTRLPTSAWVTVAAGPMKPSRPNRTPAPTTALAETTVPRPISAPAPTTAPGSTVTPSSRRAAGWTCAAGETPVSPHGPCRRVAAGNSRCITSATAR